MPTRSPTCNSSTALPFSTTRPAISCPRISGRFVREANGGQSPSATCKSEWQTPQASTFIRTSSASNDGRGMSSNARGFLNSRRTAAFIPVPSALRGGSRMPEIVLQLDPGLEEKRSRTSLETNLLSRPVPYCCTPLRKNSSALRTRSLKLCGPEKIDGPPANHRSIEPFHELREMRHRKCLGDFPAFLAFRQDFPQQAKSDFFRPTHLGRTHWIHCRRKHDGSPQPPVGFYIASHARVHSPQSLCRRGVAREFGFQMLLDAAVASPADFAQHCVLARKVAEKCGLADFENLDNVFYPRVLVPVFAEQPNRGVDNLLPQPRLFSLAETQRLPAACAICSRKASLLR